MTDLAAAPPPPGRPTPSPWRWLAAAGFLVAAVAFLLPWAYVRSCGLFEACADAGTTRYGGGEHHLLLSAGAGSLAALSAVAATRNARIVASLALIASVITLPVITVGTSFIVFADTEYLAGIFLASGAAVLLLAALLWQAWSALARRQASRAASAAKPPA